MDVEEMTIGMCLDYIQEYIDLQNPQEKVIEADQEHFDSF